MRVCFEGEPGLGVMPKDLILHLIRKIGAAAASGCAIEYAGSAIRALSKADSRSAICRWSWARSMAWSRRMKPPSHF
jgi:3-isopropylmalate/(R)-2-methylmalate dehydratase large subunit